MTRFISPAELMQRKIAEAKRLVPFAAPRVGDQQRQSARLDRRINGRFVDPAWQANRARVQ